MASGPRRHPKQWSYLHRRDLTVSHAFALDALRWMRRWLRGAQVCLAEAMVLDGSTQRIVTGLTFFSRRRIPCLCLAGASAGAGPLHERVGFTDLNESRNSSGPGKTPPVVSPIRL